MIIKRLISKQIETVLQTERIVIIIGQRQVGKTFELKRLQQNNLESLYFDFEEEVNVRNFGEISLARIEKNLGYPNKKRLVLFDEVQKLPGSGSILKLIHDHFPQTQVVASGSASYLLMKNIGDSLVGRKRILEMYPLTFREMIGELDKQGLSIGDFEKISKQAGIEANLDSVMLYGALPKVWLTRDANTKRLQLESYAQSLLFKDIFETEGIRSPSVFKKLLALLALQLGQLVNPNELAQQLQIDRKTVLEYIDIFEKFKLISVLRPFSLNPRKEITKKFKVYFTDLGIRNAIINNFAGLSGRSDIGALFENMVINLFRMKKDYGELNWQLYFWRGYHQQEIDLIVEDGNSGKLFPIEIKYAKLVKPSRSFLNLYQKRVGKSRGINKDNFWKMI